MALKSTSCSILLHRGSQPGDLRSCTYVISFPGPHSELPVSLFAPVRTSRPAQQTCPSACPCPGSSLRDFAPRCSFVWGCQMRCGASVTCAPLRRRQIACFSRACPYPAAALLCHLGPLLHFRKSASGCCQPPPAGGPLAADLSNCTRRAGRQHPAPPGPTRCTSLGGPRGAQLQLGCSRPSTLRAAWNQRQAAVAGWGRVHCAVQARRIGPATGRTSPPERLLPVCSLPIHRLRAAYGSCIMRYQARQLCWRKCRVAAASSGLVCARPKLLGASFACDFDRECQMRRRFVDATQRAGSFARCASSTLISVRSCGLWRLTGG
jgi:hypothetical protein